MNTTGSRTVNALVASATILSTIFLFGSFCFAQSVSSQSVRATKGISDERSALEYAVFEFAFEASESDTTFSATIDISELGIMNVRQIINTQVSYFFEASTPYPTALINLDMLDCPERGYILSSEAGVPSTYQLLCNKDNAGFFAEYIQGMITIQYLK